MSAAHKREKQDGTSFMSLELQGDVVLIQSSKTGRFYATAKRCFISCTFDEETAKALIGTQLPGNVHKVPCDPYEYTLPETGEVVELSYKYSYVPEGGTAPAM